MKYSFLLIFSATLAFRVSAQLPTNNPQEKKILLPNGWSLTPAGRSLPLGDFPLNLQISGSGLLAVTNNGQGKQNLQLIDTRTEKETDSKKIKTSWYGLRFSGNGKTLYASGGNDNFILAYSIKNQKFSGTDTIFLGKKWPEKISPAGIEIDDDAKKLYTVTKEDNSLYIVDLTTKKVIRKMPLGHEAYTCILSPDKKKLYISVWGGDKVDVYNTVSGSLDTGIPVGSNPNELILSKNGNWLFVANANDNSVSVINTKTVKVVEIISTSLYPTKLTGSTTNGLALSADQKTLYIANADNNCLAVFDVSEPGKSRSKGFIPTGWYPTNVRFNGSKIFVANGKGFSSLANPHGPQPVKKSDDSGVHKGSTERQYIGSLFKGTLSIIDAPSEAQLQTYSAQVYQNSPFRENSERIGKGIENNPIPTHAGQSSPIKHVFYVIKENRTYDQVLGDIEKGNGDKSLCLFPERITPNQHALVNQFVLLDNFYVDAEVSADGHNWSMAAYATDFLEKNWPVSYGGHGGSVSYTGGTKVAMPKDGYIWDYAKRAGISYRTYGEFANGQRANIKSVDGHFCPGFPSFNLRFKDIDRYAIWEHDFDSLLAAGAVPQLTTIKFPNDHTSGQKTGEYTPYAHVADNDWAVGKFIEHISHSSIWSSSAIFILEDDAQNGPDHIDAHRSPAYVISPFVKHNTVNHTMYSTSGMLRTIELILGLPPMSQYDASATPFFDCFTNTPDLSTFKSRKPPINMDEKNAAVNNSSKRSESFNFTKEDEAPDLDLNEVVWKFVKGEDSVMPAPKRSAFVKLVKKKDDDDD